LIFIQTDGVCEITPSAEVTRIAFIQTSQEEYRYDDNNYHNDNYDRLNQTFRHIYSRDLQFYRKTKACRPKYEYGRHEEEFLTRVIRGENSNRARNSETGSCSSGQTRHFRR